MIDLLLIIYSVFFLYLIRLKSNNFLSFFVYFFPIFVLLNLILGLQEGVGTDYNSYLFLADASSDNSIFFDKGEYLFHFLLYISRLLDNPQAIFCINSNVFFCFDYF